MNRLVALLLALSLAGCIVFDKRAKASPSISSPPR